MITGLAVRDDESLAREAREGSHLAFAELYRRYRPIVESYVYPRISPGADDVVQNVFVSIHRGLGSYKGPRFFSWAYRICVNAVVDELRYRRRRGGEAVQVSRESDHGAGDVPTPEEELIARRLLTTLSGTLKELPEAQRTVFVLARIEGLDYKEISELLSIPVGTVKSRMWQAVRTLLVSSPQVSS